MPVIRDAGRVDRLLELNAASKELADKARAGKLTPDEMTGGTFTISNMGMLDVENFTAIINPGEGAILAVASAKPQPVARDGKIVVRADHEDDALLPTTGSMDGALGAQFINAIKQKLEDIELWKRLTS